jgi:hypothetical protein
MLTVWLKDSQSLFLNGYIVGLTNKLCLKPYNVLYDMWNGNENI